METYPLTSISVEEATQKQFQLIDEITKVFKGTDILTRGDLGVVPEYNRPVTTVKTEEVIANFFNAEAAMLVRGAGTMAIRLALYASLPKNGTLLIHEAPVYKTTQTTIEMLGLNTVRSNFNDRKHLLETIENEDVDGVLVQLTRQKPDDSYDSQEVIDLIREIKPELPIITDDNYAVMKIPNIGVEQGANLSCFSTFKLLGPEGIGCIVGDKEAIDSLRQENYSGGLQVQGHEAIDVLRGLTYAPVSLAISAKVADEVCTRLNDGEVEGVKEAFIANAQSKVILVTFEKPIAKEVLKHAEQLGAAPNPVGAESQYEFVPMFYRVSSTFKEAILNVEENTIRINPMRAGSDTILRIIKSSLQKLEER